MRLEVVLCSSIRWMINTNEPICVLLKDGARLYFAVETVSSSERF